MEVIQTAGAPKAIGPYSQAIQVGGLLFCSGQIGMDPTTGELVAGGVAEQAHRALRNLEAVLQAAGLGLTDVVKTTVYLSSMDDFAEMNDVYSGFFADPAPARSTVAVAGLPKGALFEVEAMAQKTPVSK